MQWTDCGLVVVIAVLLCGVQRGRPRHGWALSRRVSAQFLGCSESEFEFELFGFPCMNYTRDVAGDLQSDVEVRIFSH